MKSDVNSTAPYQETGNAPNKEALRQAFEHGAKARRQVARDIESRLEQVFVPLPSFPSIKIRAKRFESYYRKYLSLLKAGSPAPVITDLIGIRIVCPFIEDMSMVEELIKTHFEVIEVERKGHYTFREFGYESTHLLIKLPPDIAEKRGHTDCDVAEIQIRTILQDAWAEVEHELVYKAEFTPFDMPMKRKLAAVNASLSLADIIFQEIRDYQKNLNSQLEKRRESFFQKIEESTDALLFSDALVPKMTLPGTIPVSTASSSIDDLLLNALYAHNKNRFEEAIATYSRILELKPDNTICSLIYKHRGMANFAQSNYQDAVTDFSSALDLDGTAYKVAYYRGIVHSVLKHYSRAIDDFSISLGINPYQAFCLLRRGQAFYHTGDYPQALSDCEASLSMEPQNETAQKFRDLLRAKLQM